MANELLAILSRANLALSIAALVALGLRWPLRRWFGPQRAYALWLIGPLALLGAFMPAPRGSGPQRLLESADSGVRSLLSAAPAAYDVLIVLWVAGLCLTLALAARRHAQFTAEVKAGRAGPAIIGVIRPQLITPMGFRTQFAPRAQVLIRAHERVHIERYDARWNALAMLFQAVVWFNPIIHVAVRAMNLDQELACDAAVIDRFPEDRLTYAKALMSAQAPVAASPLGCNWVSGRVHPLVARLGMIANRPGTVQQDGLWIALSLTLWTGAFVAAWFVQPPDRRLDRHAVQYVHYTGAGTGGSTAIWRIALNPD